MRFRWYDYPVLLALLASFVWMSLQMYPLEEVYLNMPGSPKWFVTTYWWYIKLFILLAPTSMISYLFHNFRQEQAQRATKLRRLFGA
ncbi:MAG: hypothetical protein BWY68_00755 [bacterium ADurb.Bin400]|nr:MAG: hypothetical protein BWY68_00755 [bacterium ADurb.Bin400]